MLKRLMAFGVTAIISLIVIYCFLEVIYIEDQRLVHPGWHTTVTTGKPLLKLSLISMLSITVISNLIFSTSRGIANRRIKDNLSDKEE